MRIVHYSPWALGPERGTTVSTLGWCDALARNGMDVRLLVDEETMTRPSPKGIDCRPVRHRYRGRMTTPVHIERLVEDADVVVVHGGWTAWTISAGRQAARTNIPYVVTTHGVYYPQTFRRREFAKDVWNRLLERRHLNHALALHLFFSDERDGLDQLGVTTGTVVAPNGVPIREGVRWDGGSGGYLLWLGRFDTHVKALDLLVRSLSLIPDAVRPSLRLHGPEFRGNKERLRQLVEDVGLNDWILIGEPVYGDEKWRLMIEAAAFVYPSRWDASPMAVAEAIGAAVPTLVTDYPLGRLLAAERAAIMCERSLEGIANGIRSLLDGGRVELSKRAEQVALGSLSWDTVATSWIGQVDHLLSARNFR